MARRYAICVGVNDYANAPHAALPFARSDAQEVSRILTSDLRGGFDGVSLLLDSAATKKQLQNTIDEVLQSPLLQPDDLVLMYFAGHGVLDKHNDLCLVPHDFELQKNGDLAFSTVLHSKEIELSVSNSAVNNLLILLDCCHSGALGKMLGRIGLSESANVFIIGASRTSEPAHEHATLQHGVFTDALLRSFNRPPDRGEWITLGAILQSVTTAMSHTSGVQSMQNTAQFTHLDIPITRNPSFSLESTAFTLEVAATFRLANYDIVQSPRAKADNFFIASVKAGYDTTHSGVLCLDNALTEVTADHIQQFVLMAQELYHDHAISRAWLITRHAVPDQLLKLLNTSPIAQWSTIADRLRTAVDFTRYLNQLIDDFDKDGADRPGEPAPTRFFVNLEAETRHDAGVTGIDNVADFLFRWANRKGRTKLALLGDYGTGKTTLCKRVARDLAHKYLTSLDKENRRIPLVVPLREFPKGRADLETFISGYLARRRIANTNYDALKTMNDAGLLVLILDGFDEMAVHADEDTIYANMSQIDHLSASPRSKVVLTTRPEYFKTEQEQDGALRPDGLLPHSKRYETLYLRPFNEDQIKLFLQKRLPLVEDVKDNWTYYYAEIKRIHDLSDLSRRPVLLEMIVKTLPRLLEKQKESGQAVNRPLLYETYLKGELQRQAVEKRRELLIRRDDRFLMMQTLALHFYIDRVHGLKAETIQKIVAGRFTAKQREEMESHTRDFLTCSFLARQADTYSFSHRSLMEYLAARALVEEIRGLQPSSFAKRLLTKEVLAFLAEMAPNKDKLSRLIHRAGF